MIGETKKIKAVLFGAGVTGKEVIRHITERDAELLAVFEVDEKVVGSDSGTVAGMETNGVIIEHLSEAARVLAETKPDVAVVCTVSEMKNLYPVFEVCAENGVNVITTSELIYYPFTVYPKEGKALNELAEKHGITIAASGVQDAFFTMLPAVISSACYDVKKISVTNLAPLDHFEYWKSMGIGGTKEEYLRIAEEWAAEVASDEDAPLEYDTMAIAAEVTAQVMGLHVTGAREEETEILLAEKDTHIPTVDITIQKGMVIGQKQKSVLETAEGIELESVFISKMTDWDNGETPYNKVEVKGLPDLDLFTTDMHGEFTTTAAVLNRIPDVIKAEPGYKTVAQLGLPGFRRSFAV